MVAACPRGTCQVLHAFNPQPESITFAERYSDGDGARELKWTTRSRVTLAGWPFVLRRVQSCLCRCDSVAVENWPQHQVDTARGTAFKSPDWYLMASCAFTWCAFRFPCQLAWRLCGAGGRETVFVLRGNPLQTRVVPCFFCVFYL